MLHAHHEATLQSTAQGRSAGTEGLSHLITTFRTRLSTCTLLLIWLPAFEISQHFVITCIQIPKLFHHEQQGLYAHLCAYKLAAASTKYEDFCGTLSSQAARGVCVAKVVAWLTDSGLVTGAVTEMIITQSMGNSMAGLVVFNCTAKHV